MSGSRVERVELPKLFKTEASDTRSRATGFGIYLAGFSLAFAQFFLTVSPIYQKYITYLLVLQFTVRVYLAS